MNSATLPSTAHGCCAEQAQHPAIIENSPGLSSLAYRIGTHSGFKSAMQGALAQQPALVGLTTRKDDDPSMALLDGWASVLDVLSFYQERIANEGYLRTATERRSLLELARAIGYELNPGVAASAYLAFTLEQAVGSPSVVTIEAGTQAQSIPGPNEIAQTFETVAAVEGRAAWNSLEPRLSRPQLLKIIDGKLYRADLDGVDRLVTELYFSGAATNLKAGELLLVVLKNADEETEAAVLRTLQVIADHTASRTRVTCETVAAEQSESAAKTAPASGRVSTLFPTGPTRPGATPLNDSIVRDLILGQDWSEAELSAIATLYNWDLKELLVIIQRLTQPVALLAGEGVYALRTKLGFFGHNAPYYTTVSTATYPNNWDPSGGWEIWKDSLTNGYYADADVYLERPVPNLVKDSWAVLETASSSGTTYSVFGIRDVSDASIAGFGLSGRAAAVKLAHLDGTILVAGDKAADLTVRKASAHVGSELLELAQLSIEDPLLAGAVQIELNGMIADLRAGQLIAISGERADAVGVTTAEILTLASAVHGDGFTTLYLTTGLANSYVRATVTLNANVAAATHGETRTEVLGSGDGSRGFQGFELKQQPLTYISAATSSGSESTLEVRVNNLLWEEVPSLLGHGPADRVYVTRRSDDGTVSVTFGDGITGARLPTGSENVTATYRVGSGLQGSVSAGQISLLLTRSLGLSGVTNPLASSGAADAETLDAGRLSAPLTVLTMERIVSLQDFEDFARCFAGIAKAQVTLLWNGEQQIVHLTIAGMDGTAVDPASQLYRNLSAAIDAAGHIEQTVQIDSYQPLLFSVAARILVDERYLASDVFAAVAASLMESFSFEQRSFGQSVLKSEVLAVIQDVAGVIAVDLDALYPSEQASALNDTIAASRATLERDGVEPAELLTLHPAGIVLTEMI